jgi:TfoX/Sxy family transcriptional regulator of competence genes
MAYDEALADRIRDVLVGTPTLEEKKMFGGIGFMIRGHMAVGIMSKGELMVRTTPERTPVLLAKPNAKGFEMNGRVMNGWILIETDALKGKALRTWIGEGVAFAEAQPVKAPGAKKKTASKKKSSSTRGGPSGPALRDRGADRSEGI